MGGCEAGQGYVSLCSVSLRLRVQCLLSEIEVWQKGSNIFANIIQSGVGGQWSGRAGQKMTT